VGVSFALPRAQQRAPRIFRVAAALLILNLLDGIFTLAAVHAGAASEANPLMAASMSWGSLHFILIKTALVSAGVLLLWRRRNRALAVAGLYAVTALYAGVLAYHLSAIGLWTSRLG
jgi:hypothetical protein